MRPIYNRVALTEQCAFIDAKYCRAEYYWVKLSARGSYVFLFFLLWEGTSTSLDVEPPRLLYLLMASIPDDSLGAAYFLGSRSNMGAHQSFGVLAAISPPFVVFSALASAVGAREDLALGYGFEE